MAVVGEGELLAVLLLPPQAVSTINRASIAIPHQATCGNKREKYVSFIDSAPLWHDGYDEGNFLADSSMKLYGRGLQVALARTSLVQQNDAHPVISHRVNRVAAFRETRLFGLIDRVPRDQLRAQ